MIGWHRNKLMNMRPSEKVIQTALKSSGQGLNASCFNLSNLLQSI
ncbi:hypothetical protein [Neisseria zoodegmatis]|nr:hypothetical protein [Neisseria zoodegmatis]